MVDFRRWSQFTPRDKRILLQREVADNYFPVQILPFRGFYCGDFIIHRELTARPSLVAPVVIIAITIMAVLCHIKFLIARSDQGDKSGSRWYRDKILMSLGRPRSDAVRVLMIDGCFSIVLFHGRLLRSLLEN